MQCLISTSGQVISCIYCLTCIQKQRDLSGMITLEIIQITVTKTSSNATAQCWCLAPMGARYPSSERMLEWQPPRTYMLGTALVCNRGAVRARASRCCASGPKPILVRYSSTPP